MRGGELRSGPCRLLPISLHPSDLPQRGQHFHQARIVLQSTKQSYTLADKQMRPWFETETGERLLMSLISCLNIWIPPSYGRARHTNMSRAGKHLVKWCCES